MPAWTLGSLVVLVALLVRVAIVLATANHLGGDAIEYDRFARSIAAGNGYPASDIAAGGPTAFFPPLFPFLLGGIYAITGNDITVARLVLALLSTATVALIGVCCWQLWGRRIA